MKPQPLPIFFSLNSLYLSSLYFRLFWISDGEETPEFLIYKYALYSVFLVYPLFIFSILIFSKMTKANMFLKFLIFGLVASGPVLYFYTFDLFEQEELLCGYMVVLIQCLIQSQTIKDEEMTARVVGVYAGKLLLWFFLLLFSLSYFLFDDNEVKMNMMFGGIYYLAVAILDYYINKSKFLTVK
ncbi:hypothetical protein [Epilithonimonas arachidiradicis]|uniref:Uncharacterized protein n=2 Tax=Epilithonimonas arachidiradicis TaxID=1617282 RepID=A0A420CMW1_9FLAO|nr:hypothetical protein [Epilithonimonas arachidiradicis]RKE79739.1 hypothetical protein BXY58_3108 [Epilithonimonas arachidiradicis]